MNRYKLLDDIMRRESTHCGFWHGAPHYTATQKLYDYFGVKDDFELSLKLNDTFIFVPDGRGFYNHPNGDNRFELYKYVKDGEIPPLHDLTDDDLDIVGQLNWSDAQYYDFSGFEDIKNRAADNEIPVLSGAWSSFFTAASQAFGMESYLVKMHTDPELVKEVMTRIVDFFLAQNKKFLDLYGKDVKGCFFGIDLGTQIDLIISPKMFDEFILPYFKKLSAQARTYGTYSVLHSCGSVVKAIPGILDAGFDGLHPIQALAEGMNAENLVMKYKYKDKIVFIGGVDTQILLREGSRQQIKDKVRYLKSLFGNNYIVSPSHETILPDVPPENIAAMAEAAWE